MCCRSGSGRILTFFLAGSGIFTTTSGLVISRYLLFYCKKCAFTKKFYKTLITEGLFLKTYNLDKTEKLKLQYGTVQTSGQCCGYEIILFSDPYSDPALAVIRIRIVHEKYFRVHLIFPQGSKNPPAIFELQIS